MTMFREDLPLQIRCSKKWEDLEGTGDTRHCSSCRSDVVNLSRRSEAAARTYLRANPNGTCIAYDFTRHGRVRFAAAKRRLPIAAGVLVLASACAEPRLDRGSDAPWSLTKSHDEAPTAWPATSTDEAPVLPAAPTAHSPAEVQDTEIGCELYEQLSALGGYGMEPPPGCDGHER